jgi:putative membrane protein
MRQPWGWGGLFLGLLVVLMAASLGLRILLFSQRRRFWKSSQAARRPGPEQILSRRVARGEIDEGEYRRRLTALRNIGDTAQ